MKVNNIDDRDLEGLWTIRKRLYDDKPLSGDQRRDLANAMDAILNRVETAEVDDVTLKMGAVFAREQKQ